MPDVHAKLSASGAKKWLNCPGSIVLEKEIPDKESVYAIEGATAHKLGELKLRRVLREITPSKYSSQKKKLDITEEMEGYTDSYCDFVIERFQAAKAKTPDAILMLEQHLDFSKWVPEGFGTGDAVIIGDGTLEIIDLKYGKGVPVTAHDNPQLKLYALGAVNAYDYVYDIDSVTMLIFQPRLDNIEIDTLSLTALLTWGNEIAGTATKAYEGSEELCSGKHCDEGFCKARPVCRVYANERKRLESLDFKKPMLLTAEEVADVIEEAERLSKWASMVKDYALDQAVNHGVKYPGFKLVEGISRRTFAVDSTLVAGALIAKGYRDDDIWPRKLKGISDLEKYLGKKTFNELIGDMVIKPQGKPTLVPESDKRQEWNSAVNDFNELIIVE